MATPEYILGSLDRCEHGRHKRDSCFSCPDGQSTGNLIIPPGTVIGHGIRHEIVVPQHDQRWEDPDVWIKHP
jgi:hypothetical protein